MGDHQAHACEGVAGRGVDTQDSGVGAVGQACEKVQLVGEFQAVIDVLRFAADMFFGTVMLDAATHTGFQVLLEECGQLGLGWGNLVMVRHKLLPASRDVAFAVR